jgi:hypothetical protein
MLRLVLRQHASDTFHSTYLRVATVTLRFSTPFWQTNLPLIMLPRIWAIMHAADYGYEGVVKLLIAWWSWHGFEWQVWSNAILICIWQMTKRFELDERRWASVYDILARQTTSSLDCLASYHVYSPLTIPLTTVSYSSWWDICCTTTSFLRLEQFSMYKAAIPTTRLGSTMTLMRHWAWGSTRF